MQNAQLRQAAGTAILKGSLDLASTQGAQLTEMIGSAAGGAPAAARSSSAIDPTSLSPYLGKTVDIRA